MRLIDADAIDYDEYWYRNGEGFTIDVCQKAQRIIDEQPTIESSGDLISRADAVKAIQNGYCACVSDCIDEINKLQNMGTDCTDFIHWISKVVADEELWELNAVGYGEIISRKLVKIGALATTEKPPYYYVPSADRPKGEWKDAYRKTANFVEFSVLACSECNYADPQMNYYNYCPNCGAEMGGSHD